MPVVNVPCSELFHRLGKEYSYEEFEDLCFDFGVELDGESSEREQAEKEGKQLSESELEQLSTEKFYKIEVAANRYDLLCTEGIVRALKVFLGQIQPPIYKNSSPKKMIEVNVKSETEKIRPIIACAVLRNVNLKGSAYNSLIDLQEKLHQNICRRRTLVSIGTHDLDQIQAPFSYEAKSPKDIEFVPLKQTEKFRADKLLDHYEMNDKTHIGKYTHIIKDSPVYPVLYDSQNVTLSLPPIINGSKSKITPETKNVFVECTAVDLTKAKIVLNMIVTMFSEYCETPFVVEPVKVNMPSGKSHVFPDLNTYTMKTTKEYINSSIGVDLSSKQIASLLSKMQLKARAKNESEVEVIVPPIRSDILHECDIMEDVAIAYGYNNIVKTQPKSVTVGKQQQLNKVSDLVRHEMATAGYIEILTLALVSIAENFDNLKRKNNGEAIHVYKPKTVGFEVARTTLLPSLLKTLASNKASQKPIQMFEVGDVILKDKSKDVGARNERQLGALYCSTTPGLEFVHGLLEKIMSKFQIPNDYKKGYSIVPSSDPTFFDGNQAEIFLYGKKVGIMGVIHPEVLENFSITDTASVLEINIEPLV
eukprot:gb/GECH01014517.1/.p1 GENE.gb/GECH01014517.1/~~gb/GECH01014517.1/.p1  ORF type:complete len:591 (+),score=151.28 gb/GECH01014517.1/:1-1773(+)